MRQPVVSVSWIIASSRSRITRFWVFGGGALGQPVAGAGDVLAAVEEEGVGALAVPPCPADLLVEGFRAVRHVQVHDEADVGPVDAHAEGDGGHHDDGLAAAEARAAPTRFSMGDRPAWKGGGEQALGASGVGAMRSVLLRLPQ